MRYNLGNCAALTVIFNDTYKNILRSFDQHRMEKVKEKEVERSVSLIENSVESTGRLRCLSGTEWIRRIRKFSDFHHPIDHRRPACWAPSETTTRCGFRRAVCVWACGMAASGCSSTHLLALPHRLNSVAGTAFAGRHPPRCWLADRRNWVARALEGHPQQDDIRAMCRLQKEECHILLTHVSADCWR